jgi:hypothetical protein
MITLSSDYSTLPSKTAKFSVSKDADGKLIFTELDHELVRLGSLAADTVFLFNNIKYRVFIEGRYHKVSLTTGNVQVVNLETKKTQNLLRRNWVQVVTL